MRNLFSTVADQFLRVAPITLLMIGSGLALLDFAILYAAADREGVLLIDHGIGLLQDYGLFSTVIGNAILAYLARRYYDAICSARTSKAVKDPTVIDEPLSLLTSMVRMDHKHRGLIYRLVLIGSLFWASNLGFHLFGDPKGHWGHKVFDSKDHILSFLASRLHNIYTWVLVIPFVLYVIILSSTQLRRVFSFARQKGAFRYDLLNPDQRGGFAFIEKAQAVFNLIIAVFYVQIMLHIGTFERMNLEHYIGIVIATFLLIFGTRIFLGDIYATIKALQLDALNVIKEKVYKNDTFSFEVLKYCYQPKLNRFSVFNIVTKSVALVVSVGVKLVPLITK